jgi:hypothetical protein
MSEIFSLVSIGTNEDKSKYIEGISYERAVVEQMLLSLQEIHKDKEVAFRIEENTRIIQLRKQIVIQKESGQTVRREHVKTRFCLKEKTKKYNFKYPLYCIQSEEDGQIVDFLFDLGNVPFAVAERAFGDIISKNPILFDTLYEEGAMNA